MFKDLNSGKFIDVEGGEAANEVNIILFERNNNDKTATYVEPMQKPRGIEYVIVNGQIVLRDGVITDARPGRALLAGR